MFTRAIVCPPASNFAEGLTTADLGTPNYERALKQHQDYCAALEQCGLRLTRLALDPLHPDSTFVEDTAILAEALPHGRASAPASGNGRCAILTRPGASSRRGEVESMRSVLANLFPALGEIQSPGTLDGGDVCEAGNHFFIGISERTNEAGAQQLAELLARLGYTASLTDRRELRSILHLKSGLSYLGHNCQAVIKALADRPEFCGYDLARVNADETYAANCIRVNDHLLVAAGYPTLEETLRDLGHHTIALEMSEFQKMDGGLSCLSLRF